jgi:hypothetical protein
MAWVGVILKVVTSTGPLLDRLLHRFFLLTLTQPNSITAALLNDHTMAA